jgi:hypothetical protein
MLGTVTRACLVDYRFVSILLKHGMLSAGLGGRRTKAKFTVADLAAAVGDHGARH